MLLDSDIISKILEVCVSPFSFIEDIINIKKIRDIENERIEDIIFRVGALVGMLNIGMYIFLIKLSDRIKLSDEIVSKYIRVFCQIVCIIIIIMNICIDCFNSLVFFMPHRPDVDFQRDTIIIVVLFILDIFLYKFLMKISSKIVSKYIRVFCQIVCKIVIVNNICMSLFYLTFCLNIDLLGDILGFILFPISIVGSLFSLNYTHIGFFIVPLLNILLYRIIYKKIPKDIKEIYNIFYIIVIIVNIVDFLRRLLFLSL